ncbi:hypothetical protein MYP_4287 [Sporocytophaga myxococcoides]|uniref:Uncharacterized protein n=1 Tax=Sporocytophaga myxococcoides TaxID=153721 RepID=A0A098LKZ8_9BACT|nr:hypothetical protein MYP_4287 [Sporocytophaga myxococcoides]
MIPFPLYCSKASIYNGFPFHLIKLLWKQNLHQSWVFGAVIYDFLIRIISLKTFYDILQWMLGYFLT